VFDYTRTTIYINNHLFLFIHLIRKTKKTVMSTPAEIVEAGNRNFEKLFNGGKLEELVALYTQQGTLLPPDKNKYQGRDQIKKFWQGARDGGVDNLRLAKGTVLEAGSDRLIETSSYEHSLGTGNYQVIWKRVAEGKNDWQLDIDIFN
jgi:ketosteroid isomerase-like protein